MLVASLFEAALRSPLNPSTGNMSTVLSWVRETGNTMKRRAILSVDLLMASEDGNMVAIDAVPQTHQGSQRLTCEF